MRAKKRWPVLALLGVTALATAAVAVATVTSQILTDTSSVRLRIDRTHFVPSADQPTFSSGWHTHPGPVLIHVEEGRLKFTQGPCNPSVVGPGETYVEAAHVPIVATANQEASWTATFIVPAGVPLRTDSPAAC